MDFSKLKNHKDSAEHGFAIHFFLDAFDETFYKSSRESFESFLKKYSHIKKWMIFSDYALHDKNKNRDVITFSIIPNILNFNNLSKILIKISKNDLKNSKKVSSNFINFINNGPIFNISISLNRDRRLHSNEILYHSKKIEMMTGQLNKWIITTPEYAAHYKELIKNLEILKQAATSPGANLKIIRDIDILSSLAAYLLFEVTKLVDPETIGWFSDRDQLLTYKAAKIKTPLIFDITHHLYYLFCLWEGIDSKKRLVLGVPNNDAKTDLWYEGFNRIPDLIAGTFSDYNDKKKLCSHQKFVPVIDKIFVNNKNNLFFTINLKDNNYTAGRLEWGQPNIK